MYRLRLVSFKFRSSELLSYSSALTNNTLKSRAGVGLTPLRRKVAHGLSKPRLSSRTYSYPRHTAMEVYQALL